MVFCFALFCLWFATGVCKFLVNCLREKRLAFDLVGYGGMPSNHSSIVCGSAVLMGLRFGWHSAGFAVAATLAFIVMMDANGLRNKVAAQAKQINALTGLTAGQQGFLRERVGHSKMEILAGIIFGASCACALNAGFVYFALW